MEWKRYQRYSEERESGTKATGGGIHHKRQGRERKGTQRIFEGGKVMAAVTGNSVVNEFLTQLKLPSNIYACSIHFGVDDLMTMEIKRYVEDDELNILTSLFEKYNLVANREEVIEEIPLEDLDQSLWCDITNIGDKQITHLNIMTGEVKKIGDPQ